MYADELTSDSEMESEVLREQVVLELYRGLSPDQQKQVYADLERKKKIIEQSKIMASMQERITALESEIKKHD